MLRQTGYLLCERYTVGTEEANIANTVTAMVNEEGWNKS